jgi:hypothetical protein
MKKKFLTLSMVLAVAFTAAFANDPNTVNEKVLASFKKTFVNAQSVNWTETEGFYKASFLLGDHRAEAYFNELGEMEGCVRDLFYVQLPMMVMTSIDKRFPDATVIDVREIINSEGTTYRITLESKGKKLRVKSDGSGNIFESERIKK